MGAAAVLGVGKAREERVERLASRTVGLEDAPLRAMRTAV